MLLNKRLQQLLLSLFLLQWNNDNKIVYMTRNIYAFQNTLNLFLHYNHWLKSYAKRFALMQKDQEVRGVPSCCVQILIRKVFCRKNVIYHIFEQFFITFLKHLVPFLVPLCLRSFLMLPAPHVVLIRWKMDK